MTSQKVLAALRAHSDEYVSGAHMAEELGLSRTAVWKAIAELKEEGWQIESATNRGYRLLSQSDVLSAEGIRERVRTPGVRILYEKATTSTNRVLKEMAADGAPEGTVLVSGEQSAGRGRMGRSFWSPAGCGVYMSILLRPHLSAMEATRITVSAAVAGARACEALTGERCGIKWVNDVMLRGKKVCGILTEASVDLESGMMNYAVLGIGINVLTPAEGYPEEIRARAGAVFDGAGLPDARCRMAAAVTDEFFSLYRDLGSAECYAAYKARCTVLDKDIDIIAPGRETRQGHVVDLDRDYALITRAPDGSTERIFSGEVSVRVQ